MDRWSTDDPCQLIDELASSIGPGVWLNLLVRSIEDAISFEESVLGARTVYRDSAFAIMAFGESFWMLHSEDTYSEHPIAAMLGRGRSKGAGCEIRLQGCDPDAAETRAKAGKYQVLAASADKPHGLRETFLVDSDGYVWVPSVLKK